VLARRRLAVRHREVALRRLCDSDPQTAEGVKAIASAAPAMRTRPWQTVRRHRPTRRALSASRSAVRQLILGGSPWLFQRQRGGLGGRAETAAFHPRACRGMGWQLASDGPVGDEEDFRRAAVSAPLVAETGADSQVCRNDQMHRHAPVPTFPCMVASAGPSDATRRPLRRMLSAYARNSGSGELMPAGFIRTDRRSTASGC